MVIQAQVFRFLVAFRWASLLPGLILLLSAQPENGPLPPGLVLAVAAAHTLLITLFHGPLNRLVQRHPWALLVDMALAVALMVLSGAHNAYYLYALSPVLAGAFFFQMRAALGYAAAFTAMYLGARWIELQVLGTTIHLENLSSQIVGAWLMAVLFGYVSILLQNLRKTGADLEDTHHQLSIIHNLTLSLQAAPEVQAVQRRVLEVVTDELGFPRAVIGLVNPISERLEAWLAYPGGVSAPAPLSLPLTPAAGPLAECLLGELQPRVLPYGERLSKDTTLNEWIGLADWHCIPLGLREHAVGVLLVALDSQVGGAHERLALLEPVASQAAVALGTTMLCINRAQNLAVERERNRIARDIHDTVAQSLFGLVFSLDACTQMLPEQPEVVRQELLELRSLASNVRHQVRQSIFNLWPSEMALESFKTGLREHANLCGGPQPFKVEFNTQGDFDRLPPDTRLALYQVAQEALANAVRHSQAGEALVQLSVQPGDIWLSVQDAGCGIDPQRVAARQNAGEMGGFGLRGIQSRVQTLGGALEVRSAPGAGTTVSVRLPAGG